jgi:ribonucleoside-diphosphate reductase alpha chain
MGDMLAALGISYGTKRATEFATDIQRILATAVYIESCDLVQRDNRPAFGCFDYQLEKNNPFLYRIANEFTYATEAQGYIESLSAEFKKKWTNNLGRRNIACLTIAPTGSLSTQTQTTSGIEPVFMISYRRRRKIDKNSGITPDFIDKTGDAFIEFNVVHHKFIEWYRAHRNENKEVVHLDGEMSFNDAKKFLEGLSVDKLNDIIKESPYFGATAMDCDWHERVNMQGKIQKFVDHSISVTVNLPRGTNDETVEDVYRTAWISGCKGCTIYVDGSRDGVLINKNEKKKCGCDEFIETNTPKRPKKLPCKIMRFSNKGEKWIAAVGLYENKPYEIFTGLAEKLDIPSGVENGFIVRNKVPKNVINEDTGMVEQIKVSRYDIEFSINGETRVIEGLSTIFNEEFWNYGKLISGILRHGMPVNYVVKSISGLKFTNDGINSWKSGVIRALKPFMKDEDLHEPCPNCGGHLRRESGCIQCMDCGWSKCGAN